MSKRTTTPFHDRPDDYPEVEHRQGAPAVDQRSIEEKYRDLSSDVVDLRLDVQRLRALVVGRDLATDELIRRVRELEAHSVLDLIPEDVRSCPVSPQPSSDPWQGPGPFPYTGKEADAIQALHDGGWQPRTTNDVIAALSCLARAIENLYGMTPEATGVVRTERLEVVEPDGTVRCVIGHDEPKGEEDASFAPGTVPPYFRLEMFASDGTREVMLTGADDGSLASLDLRNSSTSWIRTSAEARSDGNGGDVASLEVVGSPRDKHSRYKVTAFAPRHKEGVLQIT